MKKPLILCILDGIGINQTGKKDAVLSAKMPFFNDLLANFPNAKLDASGVAVGLPEGTMGNSEVGHMTIGAGRIINQFLRRFQVEDWDNNPALRDFLNADLNTVHIVGMMSDGRVHSDVNDIIKIANRVINSGKKVQIHFISDGRDVPPKSAEKYIKLFSDKLPIKTLIGRYYAMDRNDNMDRTKMAYDAIANGIAGFTADDAMTGLENAYARGETDEFIKPTIIGGAHKITANDGIIFGNYRSDRARQILRELIKTNAKMLCFSQYGEGLNEICPALLPDIPIKNTLGDVLENAGKSQLRIAETEKYNHVTYFFDAERSIDYKNETKILIASPNVATFDLKPEMSANEITDALIPVLPDFDVIILNYANGDMVGHTGNINATVSALETLDAQLARFVPRVLELNGAVIITSDHGNAEKMKDENGGIWTAHTTNPVPIILVSNEKYEIKNGGLSDIAPTMLGLLGLEKPLEMTGENLVK